MSDRPWTRLRGESVGEYELTSTTENLRKETASVSVAEPATDHHVRYLKRPIFEFVVDFVLATLPFMFIALVIAAQLQNYAPLDSVDAKRVSATLQLGPTIFPIVFAALCGHFMKSLALYKCQSGLQMKHLEHLVGAQSIFSTFEKFFFLRNWNAIGILITLTWCLSPLGGQAFIRLLKPSMGSTGTQQGINFLGPDVLMFTEIEGFSGANDALPYVESIYMSSITAPLSVRNSTRDLWNNPKIPSSRRLTAPLDTSAVATKSQNEDSGSYYGLIGIPISNLSTRADVVSQFKFQSINLDVVCTSNVNTTLSAFRNSLTGPLYNPDASNVTQGADVAWQKYWVDDSMQAGYSTSFLFAYNQTVNDFRNNISDRIQIFYGSSLSQDDTEGLAAIATCNVSPLRLSSTVFCQGQRCNVTSVSRLPTNFTDSHQNTLIESLLNGALPGIGSGGGGGMSTPTARYLTDPETTLIREPTTAPLNRVPLDILSERMSVILNTYYYASTASWMLANDLTSTLSLNNQAGFFRIQLPTILNATASVDTPHDRVYRVQQVWFTIALITSLALEIIALANIGLRWMTKIPDIFGYVSSLTLHNELCRENGLAVSSALDGLERAAELGDVKFRIADVRSDNDVGRMAFVPVSANMNETYQHGDVRLGRMYD